MPRGLSRPVATVVQAAGSPDALALGVGLTDRDGEVDGLETAPLGVALEAGKLVVGLADDDGPAHATKRRATAAAPPRARAPVARLRERITSNSYVYMAGVAA